MSPVLGKKTLKDLRTLVVYVNSKTPRLCGLDLDALQLELDHSLSTKKFVKASRTRRVARAKTRKQKVSELRAQVFKRAGGPCEACAVDRFGPPPATELDHFWSGANRRALESLEGTWALCALCHRIKHSPNERAPRSYWLETFLKHSSLYGYRAGPQRKAQAELDNLAALQGRTGEQT